MPGMDDRGPVQAELCGTVPGGRLMPCEGTVEAERTRASLGALTVGEMHLHLTPWGCWQAVGGPDTWCQAGRWACVFLIRSNCQPWRSTSFCSALRKCAWAQTQSGLLPPRSKTSIGYG